MGENYSTLFMPIPVPNPAPHKIRFSVDAASESFVVECCADFIVIGPIKLYYEHPDMFDQLGAIIDLLIDGGFDKLDCCLAMLMTLQKTSDKSEDTSGSEGWILTSLPVPQRSQPASLIYYLKYRYASTKKGKKHDPPS